MNALLFPGQGSQFVGMGNEFFSKFDTVKKVYTANCFQKFNFLGNKEINAEDLYDIYKNVLEVYQWQNCTT